jgi:hypothetical protein
MDLVYAAVKTLIHYILCLVGSHYAIDGGIHSLAQGSFSRPILWLSIQQIDDVAADGKPV